MTRLIIWSSSLWLLAVSAQAQTAEQRLGNVIGALYVENARLAGELEEARKMIEKLKAELAEAKK